MPSTCRTSSLKAVYQHRLVGTFRILVLEQVPQLAFLVGLERRLQGKRVGGKLDAFLHLLFVHGKVVGQLRGGDGAAKLLLQLRCRISLCDG